MRITKSRLSQIIKEEKMWLEVHTGGLGPGRNRKHDEEVRPTIELEEDDDLGMPADAEAQEADEEAAETEAAPYVTGQGIQKEDIMKMVREELEAMMSEEGKPSAGLSKKKKSDVAKKARKGGDIGKKGKQFDKIASKAAKKYGSKEAGEKVAAAAMWKNIKR